MADWVLKSPPIWSRDSSLSPMATSLERALLTPKVMELPYHLMLFLLHGSLGVCLPGLEDSLPSGCCKIFSYHFLHLRIEWAQPGPRTNQRVSGRPSLRATHLHPQNPDLSHKSGKQRAPEGRPHRRLQRGAPTTIATTVTGCPGGSVRNNLPRQETGFDPWAGKIPWRR